VTTLVSKRHWFADGSFSAFRDAAWN